MIPVLAVEDPEAALRHLTERLGLTPEAGERLRFGDQRLQLCKIGDPPPGMISIRLDHLALRVGDADQQHRLLASHGARLSVDFTPDGPREIAAFWERGVRYVFFDGPEGWPVEFCARIGARDPVRGHDHLAIRSADLDAVELALGGLGARRIAQHLLGAADAAVEVRFLAAGGTIFELFDEPPILRSPGPGGWIGFLRD